MPENRSITDPTRELVLPLDVEDAAAFYYNDNLYKESCISSCSREAVVTRNVGGTLILLGPGAKRLSRLHLFELMNKLALYEQLRMKLDFYCSHGSHVFTTCT